MAENITIYENKSNSQCFGHMALSVWCCIFNLYSKFSHISVYKCTNVAENVIILSFWKKHEKVMTCQVPSNRSKYIADNHFMLKLV